MKEEYSQEPEALEGVELHPEHESYAHISTRNSLVGVAILLGLVALVAIVVTLHLSRGATAILGVVVGVLLLLFLLWAVWRKTPKQRRGLPGNALLTARIKADLLTELGANDVNVDSEKGVVTLRGSVPYADFRGAAASLARRKGAHQVINELKVMPAATKPPDTYLQGFPGVTTPEGAPEVPTHLSLEEQVREALEADPRVNAYVIIISVEDGIAYLTGRQRTVQASAAATEVAAHVPGILGVSNDIEILPSV